jgi:hypothetical protein
MRHLAVAARQFALGICFAFSTRRQQIFASLRMATSEDSFSAA